MSKPMEYRLKHTMNDASKTPYYGVSFNKYDPNGHIVFAAVGGRNVIIAHLDDGRPIALRIVQTYVDDNEREKFYCCDWSVNMDTGAPFLAVAGASRIIKILDTSQGSIVKALIGHGGEINEIKFHPKDPTLLFSASNDQSVRLWSLKTTAPVLIFGGEGGHRVQVLSIDVHLSGDFLVSSGMDHAVKIWSLCTPAVKHTIESLSVSRSSSRPRFRSHKSKENCCSSQGMATSPLNVHYPIFTTNNIHNNYVDCVRWYGDLLMTKCAADPTVVVWKPNVDLVEPEMNPDATTVVVGGPAATSKQQSEFDIIAKLEFNHCEIWYLRFGISPDYQMLAAGNQAGQVYLWDLADLPDYADEYIERQKEESSGSAKKKAKEKKSKNGVTKKPAIVNLRLCEATVRQVAFSRDKLWMVAVCEDGSIWCCRSNNKE